MKENLQKIISDVREISGWSGSKIADELGVVQPVVSRVLSGKSSGSIRTYLNAIDLRDRLMGKRKSKRKSS